ncbi:MAG: DUF4368 domain-containing protein [Oscillospiraceae bacterium]
MMRESWTVCRAIAAWITWCSRKAQEISAFKAEKIDGHRVQRIQIIYNCIGAVELPSKQEKTA